MTAQRLPTLGTPLETQEREGGLRLDYLFATLKRQIFLIAGITTVTASMAVLKAVTDEPIFRAQLELLTPIATPESQVISNLGSERIEFAPNSAGAGVDATTLKILRSPRVIDPVLDELHQEYPDISYNEIVANLGLVPSDDGTVLTVAYKNTASEKVMRVLDVILDAYLRYSLEDRQNDVFRGIKFVDEQLPIAREKVQELESELELLRQNYNLIDPILQGTQLTQQAAKFSSQQFDLRVEISQAQALYQDLANELARGEERASTSALQQSSRYQGLLDRLTELDSQIAADLSIYLEDSPEIDVIIDHRNNLQPIIEQEGIRVQDQIASQIRELNDRDLALSNTIDILNQEIKDLSTVARQYNDIQRELNIATENLNQFLSKREELRIDAAQRQTPWELLTPASVPRASSASVQQNLVLGLVLGVMLGAGAALAWDKLKGKINTVKELKDLTKIPLLSSIPHSQLLENGQSLALAMNQLGALGFNTDFAFNEDNSESTPFLESLKRLSTNLRLIHPDKPLKTLTISSAIPNSGKSTISYHLAYINASMGQRTLLIDADLRRPTLHHLCDVSNDQGVSTYALGGASLDDIVVNLPANENLYLLPAGTIPPDPVQVLTSKRMDQLLQEACQKFDMIIVDTSPLLGFADAFIATGKTQGLLLTARLEHITFSQFNAVIDELAISKLPIVGMVANGVRQEGNESQYYYNYYYRKPSGLPGEEFQKINGHSQTAKEPSWQESLLSPISKYWKK
ncbi:MAG: polysaccharide biosynthesis tyrosine autokinase [Cyanobacteria bacterium P01_D01_bin.156]